MEYRHLVALAMLALSGCSTMQRLKAFETNLAAQDSATAALTQWCAARGIAAPAEIRAERVSGAMPAGLGAAIGHWLDPAPGEDIGFRHVRLRCGAVVLSEAYNWYLPMRLPSAVNSQLESSDVPFGRALAPYHFTRTRLASQRGRAPECPAGTVLSQSALLRLPGAGPVSYVVECYTRANLRGRIS